MYQGIRCRESVPLPPTKTEMKVLEKKLQAIKYEISIGQFQYLKHFPESKKGKKLQANSSDHLTIEQALIDWLRRTQAKCEKSTIRDYRSVVYHHLIPAFGQLTVGELNSTTIKNWLSKLDCSNKRKNNILIPLRQLYDDLFTDEVIDKNPLERIKNLSVRTREPEPFHLEEISRILDQLQGQERNLIQFAFWSGLRTSELIALNWKDVDLEKGCIYIRTAKVMGSIKQTKTTAGMRTVNLEPEAKAALEDQLQYTKQAGTVFHDSRKNKPWESDRAIRRLVWIPALKRAGIKYRNPYQTRHTFASMLLSRGENPLKVAQQMGHKDWGMIRKVYGRWLL